MKNLKTLSIVVLLVLAVIVILQNTETVETKLLFISVAMPRAVLLIVTLLVGAGGGLVLGHRLNKKRPDPAS